MNGKLKERRRRGGGGEGGVGVKVLDIGGGYLGVDGVGGDDGRFGGGRLLEWRSGVGKMERRGRRRDPLRRW